MNKLQAFETPLPWYHHLFLGMPTECIGYKEAVDSYAVKPFCTPNTQFFIANPIQRFDALQPASLANIAQYQNIVVEFDVGTVIAQRKKVEEAGLPYATATFSGNKSVHFVVSVFDRFSSLEEYSWFARAIYHVLDGDPDPKCKNANRLTRVPGSIRLDNGATQILLDVKTRITKAMLHSWLLNHPKVRNKFARFQAKERDDEIAKNRHAAQVLANGIPTPIPAIYEEMLERGTPHPDTPHSRHDSLVKFAAWLTHNGYNAEELEIYIEHASDAMGLSGRSDAESIVAYFTRGMRRGRI